MPIYAYRCEACGFAKDVLQKVSDPQLTVCLSCGEARFKKQVTAAGFQLKGTGWYATDFRNGAGTTAPAVGTAGGEGNGDKAGNGNDGGNGANGDKSGDKPAGDKASGDKAGADKSAAAGPAATPAASGNTTTAAPGGSSSSSAG